MVKTKPVRFTRPVKKKNSDTGKVVVSFSITNHLSGKMWNQLKEKLLAAQKEFLDETYPSEPLAADLP